MAAAHVDDRAERREVVGLRDRPRDADRQLLHRAVEDVGALRILGHPLERAHPRDELRRGLARAHGVREPSPGGPDARPSPQHGPVAHRVGGVRAEVGAHGRQREAGVRLGRDLEHDERAQQAVDRGRAARPPRPRPPRGRRVAVPSASGIFRTAAAWSACETQTLMIRRDSLTGGGSSGVVMPAKIRRRRGRNLEKRPGVGAGRDDRQDLEVVARRDLLHERQRARGLVQLHHGQRAVAEHVDELADLVERAPHVPLGGARDIDHRSTDGPSVLGALQQQQADAVGRRRGSGRSR